MAPRAEPVRVFCSATKNSTNPDIAHLIREVAGGRYVAHCGHSFDPLYERKTSYKTRLCINCVRAKDRRDCT